MSKSGALRIDPGAGGALGKALMLPAVAAVVLLAQLALPQRAASSTSDSPAASRATAYDADPVITAAGDIARPPPNSDAGHKATSDLVLGIKPTAALTLGDNQYDSGTLAEFRGAYDKTWGRFAADGIPTKPVPGDEEYKTPGAAGYFDYFQSVGIGAGERGDGYYSYDIGAWHLIALNSEIDVGAGSPQEQWLRQDLAGRRNACTLAYWHTPLFSSGSAKSNGVQGLWKALYEFKADVVLNGHTHFYERFAPQNPDGKRDPSGIRQFIVGTGGHSHGTPKGGEPNSELATNTSFGVLKLTLHPDSYDWQFVPIPGEDGNKDSGSSNCVGATLPPPLPPRITSVEPSGSFTPGSSGGVVVSGSDFAQNPAVSFGQGIAVNSVTFVSSARLDVSLSVARDAALGPRDVTVTNSGGAAGTCAGCFRVVQPPGGPPPPPSPSSYWLVARDGGIFSFGDARFLGSTGAIKLNQPIVGMANTPSGKGYWLVASDGGVFAFGDARFLGSTGAIKLNQPIVGMASTPSGQGYWLVARDGGIFSFGDARFLGSTGAIKLNQPIVGMASTSGGQGYWLVARDGGIFSFGDAVFRGSTGAIRLNQPIVGMASTPGGQGYWLVARDGGIFSFGDARFLGSTGAIKLNQPIVGMASTPGGQGYWLVASDGGIFSFGDAVFRGSTGAIRLNQPIAGMARTAI